MFDRHLAFMAKTTPQATAMALSYDESPTSVVDVSYAMLESAVSRMARALEGMGDASLVAVRVADPHVRWIATLALARIGVPSASYEAASESAALALLRPDAVVADGPAPAGEDRPGVTWIHVSREWMSAAMASNAATPGPAREVDPAGLGRLLLTEPRRGEPTRMVPLSWAQVEHRVLRACREAGAAGRLARVLVVRQDGRHAFETPLATFSQGGAVLVAPRRPDLLAASLRRLRPSLLVATPAGIRAVLDALPPGSVPPPGMSVTVTGVPLAADTARDIRLRLSSDVTVSHGYPETGTVAHGPAARLGGDPHAAGWTVPGADVAVVDDGGSRAPAGTPGQVAVSGTDVVTGYFEDDAGTAGRFSGDRFFPAEIGTLSDDGLLRVEGGVEDMVDLGGVGLMPAALERIALGVPGVVAAAAIVPADMGRPGPWLALERLPGTNPDAAGSAVMAAVGRRTGGVAGIGVAWFGSLPRDAGGMVDRAMAATLLAEARNGKGDTDDGT